MTVSKIFEQVQFADASYSNFLAVAGELIEGTPTGVQTEAGLVAGEFAPAQAAHFVTNYHVLHHRPNTRSGFSAMLVGSNDSANPGLTIVFRGTELFTGFPDFPDLLGAGVQGIVGYGAAIEQIVDLYNYWQRLTSPAGAPVRLARIATTTDVNASGIFFPTVQSPGATYLRIEFFQSA